MNKKLPVLYLHGGPGMNSFGEEKILGPLFPTDSFQVEFWNEPGFSGASAYSKLVESARESLLRLWRSQGPVKVIAHSFGANTALDLATTNPEAVASLVFVAPALSLRSALRNILKIASGDFRSTALEKSERIETLLLDGSDRILDERMREGLGLATQDPLLFTHYWQNQEQMAQYFGAWVEKSAQMNLEAFFSVLQELDSMQERMRSFPISKIPAVCIFGDSDPVVAEAEEKMHLQKLFKLITFVTYEGAGHFAHLEKPKEFVQNIVG